MFDRSASYYDLIYDPHRDYAAEVDEIDRIVRSSLPSAKTMLDVGCGTGRHAALLQLHGYEVSGIDIEIAFVEIASERNPKGRFEVADMAAFDLGEGFDVVLSLFSAIGYVETEERLRQAARCLAAHTRPGGIVLIEPWFEPGQITSGRIYMRAVEDEEVKVCRMSRTFVEGDVTVLQFEYLVGSAESIERFSETHRMGLFSREQMTAAFEEAGLEVEHRTEGISDRGLYLCRRPEAS